MANKTQPMELKPSDYLDAISDPQRQADCRQIHAIMQAASGEDPKIWGSSLKSGMVGFGDYHYVYESGREGDFFRTGYSNRAANISIYVMPGYQDFDDELSRLGKHKMGKSCLYIKRLSDVDVDVLEEIIRKGLAIMAEKYPQ
ncbi:MAG: DUF1801 domain-containing protein [Pseudomonadota bacterium]